ncbi:DNA topoisomerase [Gryganskiella cystojenkinii]|nr:DNA topoisomerase [Gryganskiella cystojenkinii]
MKVLCVAEKPSMAKALAQILSSGQMQSDTVPGNKYTRNYSFQYKIDNYTMIEVVMTAVLGHLLSSDFPSRYGWRSCHPVELYDAEIVKQTSQHLQAVERNLQSQAQWADQVMIWTDCDREGENIGAEVATVCRNKKARIAVTRARFSSVTPAEVHRAMRNPVELDQRQADAVDARIELDLRVGASFTRFQTLSFKHLVFQAGDFEKKNIISFGPCQFPTLGFVVDQYRKVERFTPEKFWKLELKHTKDGIEAAFSWERGQLFDPLSCFIIYEGCLEVQSPIAVITEVTAKPTSKWKPLPLTTVELQKNGSKYLSMSSDEIMTAAESLYTQGWISYPRTETDQFDHNYDLLALVQKQTINPQWGNFAQRLVEGGYRIPKRGKNNDQAHPPIHPVMHTQNLPEREQKVYEFIVRRFLACCSEDAKGDQTNVVAMIDTETFKATGLTIRERNYLDIYKYDKWSDNVLPEFNMGERFDPTSFKMVEGATSSPTLLTESQLIAIMDERGIGTDATIADHIKTITDRGYVIRERRGREFVFSPSTLGIALVEGYDSMNLPKNLSKPLLRSQLERNLKLICTGEKRKEDVIAEAVRQYRAIFEDVNLMKNMLKDSIQRNVDPPAPDGQPPPAYGPNAGGGNGGGGGGWRGGGGGGGGAGGGNGGGGYGGGRGGNGGPMPPPNNPFRQQPPNNNPPQRQVRPALQDRQTNNNSNFNNDNFGGNTWNNTGNEADGVNCRCEGQPPAVERKVVKEGENQGRMFYTCAKPREEQCGFFEFSDSLGSKTGTGSGGGGGTNRNVGESDSFSQNGLHASSVYHETLRAGSVVEGKPRCHCKLIAVESVSAKHNGRIYWKCSKKKTCGFFKWDDELDQSARAASTWSAAQPNRGGGGGGSSSGAGVTCYKCQQVGHFANVCPNGAAQGSTSGTSSSSYQANTGTSSRGGGGGGKGKSKKGAGGGSTKSNVKAVRVTKKSRPI